MTDLAARNRGIGGTGSGRIRWPRCLTFPRAPDFIIGTESDPYLRRWMFLPGNDWCNIYLHHFLRSDDPRALHDHPWSFVSIILTGGYREVQADGSRRVHRPGSVLFRRAAAAHRVELLADLDATEQPAAFRSAWTVILRGPKVREWGFHCPSGWRHWRDFCAPGNSGLTGRGCE